MMTFAEQVQRVRRMLAEGKTVEEIVSALEDAEPGVAKAALRRALIDREYQNYQPEESAIIFAAYRIIPPSILAAAIGRSLDSIRVFACVHGATNRKLLCPNCGQEMTMEGIPFAAFNGGRGNIRWSVRCKSCAHERVYDFSWVEIGPAYNSTGGENGKTAD